MSSYTIYFNRCEIKKHHILTFFVWKLVISFKIIKYKALFIVLLRYKEKGVLALSAYMTLHTCTQNGGLLVLFCMQAADQYR